MSVPLVSSVPPETDSIEEVTRPPGQLLKWVGNKFRYAELIAHHFPSDFNTFLEPFVGTGALTATIAPTNGVASDTISPLIDFHQLVQSDPTQLLDHYEFSRRWIEVEGKDAYGKIRMRFNSDPNPLDLLVISRACYGGVMRFTRDGELSTPMGPHKMMSTEKLGTYMLDWRERVKGVDFQHQDFRTTIAGADEGDLVYCDPPYIHGQSILYGAQDFDERDLWEVCEEAIARGVRVAVSVDGYRQSGKKEIPLQLSPDLFKQELLVRRGGCMLRRFQLEGSDTSGEEVADRLLLSWAENAD